jgi:pyridoxal phosphate enzyme (YggS family)
MLDVIEIRERYAAVQERVAAAAARAGRSAEEVTLVAVTKTWPAELVLAAYEAGMRHFGENRAEELTAKRPQVEQALGPDSGILWHLIGSLQSRKTDLAADYADLFHALDRGKIARRLSAALVANGRSLPAFIEVNLSGEATKSGLDLSRWEADATQGQNLRKMITDTAALPGLPVIGLMTMAPWEVDEAIIRNAFKRAKALAEWLRAELPGETALCLSMGMTDDFEVAIEEGATHVRIGRALFGDRQI